MLSLMDSSRPLCTLTTYQRLLLAFGAPFSVGSMLNGGSGGGSPGGLPSGGWESGVGNSSVMHEPWPGFSSLAVITTEALSGYQHPEYCLAPEPPPLASEAKPSLDRLQTRIRSKAERLREPQPYPASISSKGTMTPCSARLRWQSGSRRMPGNSQSGIRSKGRRPPAKSAP